MSCGRTKLDATMRHHLEHIATSAEGGRFPKAESIVRVRRGDLADLLHDLKLWEPKR